MTPLRAAFIPIVLGAPALLAPSLARLGRRLPAPARRSLAGLICAVPLLAPLACDRARHPGNTLLIAILGRPGRRAWCRDS